MRRLVPLVVLVALVGCSQHPRHNYTVASVSVASALFAIQDAEDAAYRAGKLTPAQHVAFNQTLAPALEVGQAFNAAVLAWQPGETPPQQLPRLKELLLTLSTEVIATFPAEVRAEIQRTITATYDAVLAVLLAVGGAT